jgi:(R,R)-butanediol dehydrogenase/meso-butanediol dehydrogenase/diacetyl reductase
MTMMHAAIFDDAGHPLRLAEVGRPEPAPHQVVIRVAACGICGSDLHATAHDGGIARRGGVLGHEVTGIIEELGSDVTGWAVGDRVYVMPIGSCGVCPRCLLDQPERCPEQITFGALGDDQPDGAFAQYLACSATDLITVPEGVPLDVAALTEPLATGLLCVKQAELRIGDRVLVVGAGPIGLSATLFARFFGARRVAVSDFVEHRLNLAGKLGATDVINGAAVADVRAEFIERTGAPPDVVIEAVGRPGLLNEAIRLVAEGGRVVTGGVCMEPDSFDHLGAYEREPSIRTAKTYTKEQNRFILEMVAAGRLDPSPMISHRVTLEELPASFDALRRPTDQCKVIVTP